jgi:ribosomal protein S18 acetylase RimI-like enzyme
LKIIKATKQNATDIVSLNLFVQKIHAAIHPDIFKPPINGDSNQKYFEEVIDKKDNFILLAYKDNKALGYIWVELQHRPENPYLYEHKQFYIWHVAVHEDYKGQGIGKALFDEVESIAKQQGITNFALDVWEFNKESQEIFKKLGFSIYNVNMWKKV